MSVQPFSGAVIRPVHGGCTYTVVKFKTWLTWDTVRIGTLESIVFLSAKVFLEEKKQVLVNKDQRQVEFNKDPKERATKRPHTSNVKTYTVT